MSDTIKQILTESTLKVLRPFVRVMLRHGVSSGSFEEIVRKIDVNEQPDTYCTDVEQKYNRAIRVISGCSNDDRFIGAQGNAKILPIDGKDHSFVALVKLYSDDIPTKTMLNLLIDANCVSIKNNTVQLIKQAYVPGNDPAEVIRISGTETNELISTIDYNLTTSESNKRYQRKVSSAVLNKNTVEAFKKFHRTGHRLCSRNSMRGYHEMRSIQAMKIRVMPAWELTTTNNNVQERDNEYTNHKKHFRGNYRINTGCMRRK